MKALTRTRRQDKEMTQNGFDGTLRPRNTSFDKSLDGYSTLRATESLESQVNLLRAQLPDNSMTN